jgi:hypothetical protein
MHSRHLAELAAHLVLQSADPPRCGEPTVELIKQYWAASKCRLEAWQRALRMFGRDLVAADPWHDPWPAIEVVLQEILISELATRVWSAVLLQRDRSARVHELSGPAQGIYIAHLETANQALLLLSSVDASHQQGAERVDGLRRRLERWTDLLLGCLPDELAAIRFAHQRQRMLDFVADRRRQSADERTSAGAVWLAALSADLMNNTSRFAANPALNRQIAAGMLAFLSPDRFDSIGLPKPVCQIWIEQTLDETDSFLQQFERLFEPPHAGQADSDRTRWSTQPFKRK